VTGAACQVWGCPASHACACGSDSDVIARIPITIPRMSQVMMLTMSMIALARAAPCQGWLRLISRIPWTSAMMPATKP
jgi:hypothetical protein